jgi:hypothetical protein
MDSQIEYEEVSRLFPSSLRQRFLLHPFVPVSYKQFAIFYHPGFSLHFLTGVLSPLRIGSLMPGMERR